MSVSGLSRCQRQTARDRTVQAALLGLHHASAVHYTQDSLRWEGIASHKVARKGEFPRHADCSAFATWCLWNGLFLPFKVSDVVNHEHWKAGYTGTMIEGGREVHHLKNVIRGDCVLYGTHDVPRHVSIVVGHKGDTPWVVSHGSEGGPYFLPYNYRHDVGQIRRYI